MHLIIKVFSYCDSFIVIKNFGFMFLLEIYFFNYLLLAMGHEIKSIFKLIQILI